MKGFQLFSVSVGATLALGALNAASAAERLAHVVQRAPPWAGATTSAAKTFRLAGAVVDAEGKPVAGAVVACYQFDSRRWAFGGDEMELKQRVTTDASGAFDFRVPPQMTVVLARKQGLAPTWNQYPPLTSDQTEDRLPFVASTTVSGVVVDEADKPVADAEVWVSYALCERRNDEGGRWAGYLSGKPLRECLSTRTAADGKFVIQGFPTNTAADLAVSKPGKVLRELERQYVGPDSMRCQAGQQDVKLVVEPAGNIEGKVVAEETGQPLAGATLLLQHERPGFAGGREHEPAQSGADGTFRLADVAAGTYQVRAMFGTNAVPEWVAETVSVTVEAGQTVSDVKVTATRGGFLEVAVVGQDDHKPLGDASVNAFKTGYTTYATSGSDGRALLRLPKGEYRVSAYKENSRSEVATASVEAASTNRLEIALKPPPRITGVVRDASGAPAPGLELSIFPRWGQSGRGAKTDANGHYEMPWNPQQVGPMGSSFCLLARDVTHNLAAAEDIEEGTTTLDLKLQPGLVVAGSVQDENGKPLTNATVRVFLWSGNSGSQFDDKPIRTDAQGQFEITALPPGRKYSLDATAKGYGSANQNIQEEAETNRVELEPCVLRVADRKLAGEVLDADDKPVARANVFMYGPGQPNGSVRTDNKGRFKFDEVCEGSVQLSANLQNAHGGVRAEAGDTNVVIRLGVNQAYSFREAAPARFPQRQAPARSCAAGA